MKKDLGYYLKLPYTIVSRNGEGGKLFSEICELPGCEVQGDNEEDLTQKLKKAKKAWIKGAIKEGIEIPEPFKVGPRPIFFRDKFESRR